tara:strand:+ start:377 stop:820 length:444 start_codon:yes stop_codon:yes gene_type:complete
MNKRTAYVYFGAAFLIIVFGFRTLARTTASLKFLEELLTPVTILALLLEFGLLVYYAYGIYNTPESGGGSLPIGKTSTNSDSSLSAERLDDINTSLGGFTDQMSAIKDSLESHNDQIKNLNSKLEDLVDDQLDEKVKSILSSMIRKS